MPVPPPAPLPAPLPAPATIVTGLPRSGTSLMMQMLRAGGLEVLTDDRRPADPDNPRGYFEYHAVTTSRRDASWIDAAAGKIVKVVSVLLDALPTDREYRIIFMRRDVGEVVRSQRTMLERTGARGADLDDGQLAAIYASQNERTWDWLLTQVHVNAIRIDHHALMADPPKVVDALDRFLGGGLDLAAMTAAVDPSLYRQRTT